MIKVCHLRSSRINSDMSSAFQRVTSRHNGRSVSQIRSVNDVIKKTEAVTMNCSNERNGLWNKKNDQEKVLPT